ncbi:zinc-binding dehydrogenase [Brevibacillus sp. TJ4]|uniref:zinc-dependent alcohol dehydrogenase n=1 Tax=Brevibacillus sp. TJ4 TaxID=3234853 RepID=UPI0037D6864F
MKAIVYEAPHTVSLHEKARPDAGEGWALIKTSHVGICGTDLNIYSGHHPRAQAPLVMGHEFSGTLVTGHPTLAEGTAVTVNPLLSCGTCLPCRTGQSHVCETLKLVGIDCDGGMAEYVKAPVHQIVPLPGGLTLSTGALVEPVAVAVHAVRQGGYVPGDQAVVFGAGTIGLCVALTLRSYGADDVVVVETNEHRIKKAEELGFATIDPSREQTRDVILSHTGGKGADFVFDCAGHPSVVPLLTEVVKVRGTVVIVAAYKKPPEVHLLQGMFKELTMRFVRVYTSADFERAAQLLAHQRDFARIITHVLPPEQARQGFDLLTSHTDAVKVMYQF